MDKSIFRAYDIRGVYPTELNEQDAYQIAHGIFEYLGEPRVVAVGRDARLSAPALQRAVCQAFSELGTEVIDLGMVSSDMVAFVAGREICDVGIIISASHNPSEWIGMKISKRGGGSVGGSGEIEDIQKIVEAKYSDKKYVAGTEVFKKLNILPDWVSHVLNQVDKSAIKRFKIVVDAGNGVAGPIVRELAQSLSLDIEEMYFEPDGNFPNHLPSPIEHENVADLQKKVVEVGADIGMAFDGDADRVFLIDEKGEIVTGSEMTALVMDAILTEDPTRTVLYNAICGWNVEDVIKKHNAKGVRVMVGHGYIKKDMKKYGAYFAGEHSGHYFFSSNFNADSGLIAAMFVLELMSKSGKTLSQLLQEHRKYLSIPEINFEVSDVKVVLDALEKEFNPRHSELVSESLAASCGLVRGQARSRNKPVLSLPNVFGMTDQENLKVDKLDGLTVRSDDWWINVRPSNTQPLLRLNVEAKDPNTLNMMKNRLTEFISRYEPVPR